MIKNFNDITEKELEYIKHNPVEIYEKLDIPYFKVEVDCDGISIYTAKNKIVTDIDCIVNVMYNDIRTFVDAYIGINYDEIFNTFGYTRLGFFYLPVHKSNQIEYNHLKEGSFILNDFFVSDKKLKDIDKLKDIMSDCFIEKPYIMTLDGVSINPNEEPSTIIKKLLVGHKTWSGEDISDIEGIILSYRNGRKKYKIIVNRVEPNIDMTTLKIYRDFIVEDFAKIINNSNIISNSTDNIDYINLICDLFMYYINETDILNRTYIEPGDLLPPKNGYIGDIEYSSLPSTIRLVCKGNEVFKNILRIIFVTFNGTCDDKFNDFLDNTRNNIINVFKQISEKTRKDKK